MTKSDLIKTLAAKSSISIIDATLIVNTIFESMSSALISGDRIEIRGLGSWSLRTRDPRVGRNPKTGEGVDVPERRVVHFKAGGPMLERLNKDKE